MCVVTYIPRKDGFILTSNRDENPDRPTLEPREYVIAQKQMVFPKDEISGGTWIAASGDGKVACLLNGAFVKHAAKQKWGRSRGNVLLERFQFEHASDFIHSVDLTDVEPFTLLLLEHSEKTGHTELIWDGENRHIVNFDSTQPRLWASSTLYDEDDKRAKRNMFESWLESVSDIIPDEVMHFHMNFKRAEKSPSNEYAKTVSVSQVNIIDKQTRFKYLNLSQGTEKTHQF